MLTSACESEAVQLENGAAKSSNRVWLPDFFPNKPIVDFGGGLFALKQGLFSDHAEFKRRLADELRFGVTMLSSLLLVLRFTGNFDTSQKASKQ